MIISYEVVFEICSMSLSNDGKKVRTPPEKSDVIGLFEKRLTYLYEVLKESKDKGKDEEDIQEIERKIEKKKDSIRKIKSIDDDKWIPFCEKIYNYEYSWPGEDETFRQKFGGK